MSAAAAAGPRAGLRTRVREAAGGDAELLSVQRRRQFSFLLMRAQSGDFFVREARDAAAGRLLAREFSNLQAVREHAGELVPRAIWTGDVDGYGVSIMTAIGGTKLTALPEAQWGTALPAARDTARRIAGNIRSRPVADEEIRSLISCAAQGVDAPAPTPVDPYVSAALAAWRRAGTRPSAAWSHNDFTAANLLLDGATVRVIDWGLATPDGFAGLDAITLAWHWLLKRALVPPAEAMRRIVARDTDDPAGGTLAPAERDLDALQLAATARTLLAVLAWRATLEQQPSRLTIIQEAAAAL